MSIRSFLSRRLRCQIHHLRPCLPPSIPPPPNPQLFHTPSSHPASDTGFLGSRIFTFRRAYTGGGSAFIELPSAHGFAVTNAFVSRGRHILQRVSFSHVRHSGFSGLQLQKFRGTGNRYYSGGEGLFSPEAMLWTLIGGNIAVFLMWRTFDYKFMEKHFTVSIDSILSGRIHTLLTHAFSQKDLDHIFSNMLGLYFFGSEIGRIFGAKYLLMLYLTGGIGGALGHMFYFSYVYPWLQKIPRMYYNLRYTPRALGASGAVTAITLLHIFLYPKHTILFQMFIPMPAAVLGAIIIGRNLWMARQGDSDISTGAHLGGALVAFLAYLSIRRPFM